MNESISAWGFVIVLVVAAYIYMNWGQSSYLVAYVKSSVDDQLYLVRNLPDKQECADRLAKVREKLLRLRTHLEQSHKDKPFVSNILSNFDCTSERFTESSPEAQYTSYTVNKGDKIHMCLRQRGEKEQLVNENIITFVALHEMAHCGTTSVGHTPDFWNHFAWLLKQAEAMHIYQYTDFAAHPVEYCGIHITDCPTYKETVKDEL
jgi:hypothetical protein